MKHFVALLFFILSGIYIPNNSLYGEYESSITAYVNDGFSSLDFSQTNPKLYRLELIDRKIINWEPLEELKYLAEDDAGLRNNINLKEIFVWNDYCEIPISLSYLPSVEKFENFLFGAYRDFDYLSQSLPSLKTIIYSGSFDLSFREKLAIRLENISKLEHLESLTIEVNLSQWGARTFTDQEIEAFSKMYSMKNLTLKLTYFNSYENTAFDKEKLQILRNLLPNTNVKIIFDLHMIYD